MGASGSRNAVAPILPATQLSAAQVAEAVKALGNPYISYSTKVVDDGMDGAFLQTLADEDLVSVLQEIGVTSIVHRKKLEALFKSFKDSASADGSGDDGGPGTAIQTPYAHLSVTIKAFAGFLSHFKLECGTEARLVQVQLRPIIEKNPIEGSSNEVFLDSDDLSDLRNLLQHVVQTKVLVLLQSKSVLTRPWVIIELYTAITHDVPIVALNIANSYPYNYADAESFLMHFDEEIDIANPGAAQLLIDMGIDPVDVAWRLSDCLPNIISTDFNPNASENVLQASLVDLVDSMRKASPIAPSMSKEEWLEKRKTHKQTPNTERRVHGSNFTSEAEPEPGSAVLAEVPTTVPELPSAYLVRPEDLRLLKEALGTSSASLTSKQQNKVGAHGMGGVGKTTIAAALVKDPEIRASFEKIVWVSVGQEPDIRELQESIYGQLSDSTIPDSAKTAELVMKALRAAARDQNILLVLDDVWDPKHEKPLNVIDSDNAASRLLVTTRIRGLLKNASEVGVGILSQGEAFRLLLSSAEMSEEDVESGSAEHQSALEIVEMCGRLPLTLAIAGGMVLDNGQCFSEDILEMMRDTQELEDEEGMTVETRVISTSEKMMIKGAGKHKDLVQSVFRFFACFPEDVPVPAAFFTKMAPLLSDDKNEKKARLGVGSCLSTLLKYNLIKGSLSVGNGVFQHDIVRDYVINQHSEEELRALQKAVIEAILAARPEQGFAIAEATAANMFEGYVARQLYFHIRGSLEDDQDELPDSLMIHPDTAIKVSLANAVGLKKLVSLSEAREAAGALVRAAEASWAAHFLKTIDMAEQFDQVYRAAALLESADDPQAAAFELEISQIAYAMDMGSERHLKLVDRTFKLGESISTFESKFAIGGAAYALANRAVYGMDFKRALEFIGKGAKSRYEAGFLSDNESVKVMMTKLYPYAMMGGFICMSEFPEWHSASQGVSEELLVEGIDFYSFERCHPAAQDAIRQDFFLVGNFLYPLLLLFGNLRAVETWVAKSTDAVGKIVSTSSDLKPFSILLCSQYWISISLCVIGCYTDARRILTAGSFTSDEEGLRRNESVIRNWTTLFPSGSNDDFYLLTLTCQMLLFLSGSVDGHWISEKLPAPKQIASMERNNVFFHLNNLMITLTGLAITCFLKLGRDNEAFELATIVVSPEQETQRPFYLSRAYSALGQVAARRGDLDDAETHFSNALEQAKRSRLPMFELIAARDWKQHLLKPNGRDASAAEAAIDAACAMMKKTRGELESVLSAGV